MDKKEFDMRKKLLEIEHDFKMKETKFKFERELEIQRIKSAEIKRTIDRKQDRKFMENY